MDETEFERRTRALGTSVIKLCDDLPPGRATDVLARQVIRSSTSVGANYRASCRGRSLSEIIAKLSIVDEEADETAYWLEVIADAVLAPKASVEPLIDETIKLLRMTVASKKTLKSRAGVRGFAAASNSSIANRES